MLTNIYLIRHALSEANVNRLYGTDAPLSEKGRKQAKVASVQYRNINPDLVISGTKLRQRTTAYIIFPDKYRGTTIPIFDEIYFGDLEGTIISEEINTHEYHRASPVGCKTLSE